MFLFCWKVIATQFRKDLLYRFRLWSGSLIGLFLKKASQYRNHLHPSEPTLKKQGSYLNMWARPLQFKYYMRNIEQLTVEQWYIWNQTLVTLLKTSTLHWMSTAGPSVIEVQHITIFKGSMIYLHSNTQHSHKGNMKSWRWKTARIRGSGVTPRGQGGGVSEASGNMNISAKASL